ncbi:phosphoribosylglycinamide formyltransferase [Pseudochryseolinea flava]|uniref:Phosphoribosylglycinamide formyltransferase n=1 Tax=Pseudochryseolinea flava TaxID=2059302 RepID=A0A364Y766_9BACT|nr:phosphoribosylglycinamide formyltransferase [Pseudochryseolinea flava]RAW02827.1 phosphoribosylglycinamide formyltransferase [Pseudochryseolinea flava]
MSDHKFRIAILASGSGSNAEEIFKHFKNHPAIEVSLLLSNNPGAYALERAKKFNIPAAVFTREEFKNGAIIQSLFAEHKITHIVLAGFLWLIPDYLIKDFPNKIINIHPALLPKFGGKGMYGMKVHEAVKANLESETGITIHEVNEHYDEGKIIFQASCSVTGDDTPESIAKKVHALEYEHFPKVIEQWITGYRA